MRFHLSARGLALLSSLMASSLLANPALAEHPAPPTITMQGQGQVQATPDMASISLGVSSYAHKASDAVRTNSEAMAQVIASLKAAGIADKDLKTEGFFVNPRFETNNPRPIGYEATNRLTAKIRNLEDLGTIMDKATASGANMMGGIQFSVSNADALLDEARKRAFADAERKAKLYAEAGGRKLGPMESVSEMGDGPVYRPMARMALMAADAAPPVPVEAGEETLSISLTVSWRLE